MEVATPIPMTASGIITSRPGYIVGTEVGGLDGVNDMNITVYDGQDDTGKIIMPNTPYDAAYEGPQGIMRPYKKQFRNGAYVKITGSGTISIVFDVVTL